MEMERGWLLGARALPKLPIVPTEQRQRILELPVDTATHARLLRELPFFDALEISRPAGPSRPATAPTRVVAWNAERCRWPGAAAGLLGRTGAEVVLLSEMDWGLARSSQRHTTREIAARLGFGYAFAAEFLELGLGNPSERERLAGQQNQVGYHGGAILSRSPIERPVVVRLGADGDWFDGERGERRVGSRIAVVGTVRLGGVDVTLASVHLESHGDPAQRASQMAMLLEALEVYRPGAPVVIGGDVNTHTLGRGDGRFRATLAQLLREDPKRLARPAPYEPLFAVAEAAGYDWHGCNDLETSTQRVGGGAGSTRGTLKLDWFFCRGLAASQPEVIPALAPDADHALSDHEAIAVTLGAC